MKTLLEESYPCTLQVFLEEANRMCLPIVRDPQVGLRFELWLHLNIGRAYV